MKKTHYELCIMNYALNTGGLAQLARATALQAVGQRFDSVILHLEKGQKRREQETQETDTGTKSDKIFDTTDRAITHGRVKSV